MTATVTALGILELVVAGLFALGGVRSFVVWVRRPIDSDALRDQLSYALYRTGRIGLWFAIAGMFLLPVLIGREGRAYSEEFARFRWYLMVPLTLALMQFVGAFLLGRSADRRPAGGRPHGRPER
ncbi:MAG: hypothetical protein ACJ77A_11890 [Actinomycetota bacterium]